MKFRKKPVVIEARKLPPWDDVEGSHALAQWCKGRFGVDAAGEYMVIATLEGGHKARTGDWIIQGIKGEFYPCKPDIFDATYEAVE